jgi:hypothetical protein
MSLTMDRSNTAHREIRDYTPRRAAPLSLVVFNLVALAAVVGPTWLILASTQQAAALTPDMQTAVTALFGIGVAACALAMLQMLRRRDRRGGLVLLVPGAIAAFALAIGLLFGLSV